MGAQSGTPASHACLLQEEDGSTCLHHAAKIGDLEMVSLLLSTGQVDVNAQVSGLRPLPIWPCVPLSALWLSLGARALHLISISLCTYAPVLCVTLDLTLFFWYWGSHS